MDNFLFSMLSVNVTFYNDVKVERMFSGLIIIIFGHRWRGNVECIYQLYTETTFFDVGYSVNKCLQHVIVEICVYFKYKKSK